MEAEREALAPRYKGGGWLVTDKFLVQSTLFSFDLLRLYDLLWAYKRVTKHSVNFIPTGKTHQAVLACYGGVATVNAKEMAVEGIIAPHSSSLTAAARARPRAARRPESF
jgi:hypothetical protein